MSFDVLCCFLLLLPLYVIRSYEQRENSLSLLSSLSLSLLFSLVLLSFVVHRLVLPKENSYCIEIIVETDFLSFIILFDVIHPEKAKKEMPPLDSCSDVERRTITSKIQFIDLCKFIYCSLSSAAPLISSRDFQANQNRKKNSSMQE